MNNKILTYAGVALMAFALFSCGKEHDPFTLIEPANPSAARIKFIHAASDTVGVNFFLNAPKINGTAIAYNGSYPVTNYTLVEPTPSTLQIIVPETIKNNVTYASKILVNTNVALSGSSHYTIAFVGITGKYNAVLLDDSSIDSMPLDGTATFIRFANFIHDSPNGLNLEISYKDALGATITKVISTNIGYTLTDASFIAIEPLAYTSIKLIDPVANKTLATASAANSTLTGNKVYTFFARGVYAKPALDRMINR